MRDAAVSICLSVVKNRPKPLIGAFRPEGEITTPPPVASYASRSPKSPPVTGSGEGQGRVVAGSPFLAYACLALKCLARFLPSQRSVRVPAGTRLLEAARLAGMPLANNCGGWGTCGLCSVRIITGGEAVAEESAGEKEARRLTGIDHDVRLACFISLERDLTVSTPHWGEAPGKVEGSVKFRV